MKKKKIAFDLHGVLDGPSIAIKCFIELALKPDVECFVLSGAPLEIIEEKIREIMEKHVPMPGKRWNVLENIQYLSVVDFAKFLYIPLIQLRKEDSNRLSWYCDIRLWDAMKAIICKENEIDIMVDDSPVYSDFFGVTHTTKYIQLQKNMRYAKLMDMIYP